MLVPVATSAWGVACGATDRRVRRRRALGCCAALARRRARLSTGIADVTAPAEVDRTEILHQLEVQHERLLAELCELDQRIEAALSNVRGDGAANASGE